MIASSPILIESSNPDAINIAEQFTQLPLLLPFVADSVVLCGRCVIQKSSFTVKPTGAKMRSFNTARCERILRSDCFRDTCPCIYLCVQ